MYCHSPGQAAELVIVSFYFRACGACLLCSGCDYEMPQETALQCHCTVGNLLCLGCDWLDMPVRYRAANSLKCLKAIAGDIFTTSR